MKKGIRMFLSEYHTPDNSLIDLVLWFHQTKFNSIVECIEYDINSSYGPNIIHNKLQTRKSWFPKLYLHKLDELAKIHRRSILVDKSCSSILNAVKSLCESLDTNHADDSFWLYVSANDYYSKTMQLISKYPQNIGSNINPLYPQNIGSNIYLDNPFRCNPDANRLNIDCVLAHDFNDFVYLDYMLNIFRDCINSVKVHMFLKGDFSLDDKNIIVTNYDRDEAALLGRFLEQLDKTNKRVNKKHIEMGEQIKINYSWCGDFTSSRIFLKGVLHIEYCRNNDNTRSEIENFVVAGIYTDSEL
jgi:hypothetical protein